MGEPTPYNVGGIDIAAGSALTVQIPPRVFLGRMTGLLFDTGKTFLLPRSLAGIRGLRRFYDQHPGVQVLVVGHTDTVGPTQYNLTLSIERSHSIAAYLRDDVDGWMEYYWADRVGALGHHRRPAHVEGAGLPSRTHHRQSVRLERRGQAVPAVERPH